MSYFVQDKPYPRGEVQFKGGSVFDGYYKRPEVNAESFDAEGWFNTGDVGLIYPNGSIKIIDRAKNIFKLSQGEYIAPEKMENIFVKSDYVAQSMLTGDSLKNCCVAVVVVDPSGVKKWAELNGETGS